MVNKHEFREELDKRLLEDDSAPDEETWGTTEEAQLENEKAMMIGLNL